MKIFVSAILVMALASAPMAQTAMTDDELDAYLDVKERKDIHFVVGGFSLLSAAVLAAASIPVWDSFVDGPRKKTYRTHLREDGEPYRAEHWVTTLVPNEGRRDLAKKMLISAGVLSVAGIVALATQPQFNLRKYRKKMRDRERWSEKFRKAKEGN